MDKKVAGAFGVGAVALSTLDGGLLYGLITGGMGAGAYYISESHAKGLNKKLAEAEPDSPTYTELLERREAHHDCSALIGITTVLCPILGLTAVVGQAVVKTVVDEAVTLKRSAEPGVA